MGYIYIFISQCLWTGADWTVGKSVIYRIKFTKKKKKKRKKKEIEKKKEKKKK